MLRGMLQLLAVAILGAMLGWILMNDAQKRWVKIQLGLELPQLETSRPQPPLSVPEMSMNGSGEEGFSLQRLGEVFQQQFNCVRPETQTISEQPRTQIFSWVDAEGRRHFSDQAPAKAKSEDLSQQYGGELSYFDLKIDSPDGSIATEVRDRLETDIRAIYRYLGRDLGIQHMRKVSLNLKVFIQPERFEAYQQEHAPELSGVAGFYTTQGNEAVVLQRTPEYTLRVARHEATHVIVAGLYGRTPMWFNEGLAEYFADYEAKAMSRTHEIPEWRAQHLRQVVDNHQLPELGTFLQVTPEQWRREDQATMYSQAWSVVAFMMGTAEGRNAMVKIMNHLSENPCSTVPSKQWVDDYFEGGWVRFEDEWHRWLDKKLIQLARK
ncbi:hypothetical protein BTA51_12475 [Hahella sp. CCB-MM4]|uniref:DUF1570 domain-containing protein n=1 Tax=Hahella sp. (strain CCB-MM4) TaxID=1926491 RepID=UPI000B9B748E|nr:DUF1570 domain-containing protein [Hahella sp. CCB-MM4]OZG73285.1 hypothetical protein BTA51_12475 [Hahella sp. CCB-MM4]